jgi:16S rRNA (uracil1498-N3)-methyltransferase
MATELGISSVIPWQASRSVSRWEGDKAEKGKIRWQSIVREASKQSIRAWVPLVHDVVSTKQLCGQDFSGLTIVLDPSGTSSVGAVLTNHSASVQGGIRLVVGPEGGIASEELEILVSAGAVVVGLGKNILRTSTAGPAVLSVINELLGRW